MKINWTPQKAATATAQGLFIDELDQVAMRISARVSEAVDRINNSQFVGRYYCGHSGGKDSVVIRFLTDEAGWPGYPTVHTAKGDGVRNAVHPKTREFLYSLDRVVTCVPESEMAYWLKTNTMAVQIDGTRRAEASRRDGRDVGLIVNGEERSRKEVQCYMPNGLFGLNFVYPIFDWSDAEVWACIFAYDIPYSKEYDEYS